MAKKTLRNGAHVVEECEYPGERGGVVYRYALRSDGIVLTQISRIVHYSWDTDTAGHRETTTWARFSKHPFTDTEWRQLKDGLVPVVQPMG